MPRRTLSAKERARLFTLHGGRCHICGGKIGVGDAWEVEHVIPLALGGADDDHNRRPAHVKCHRSKTDGDVTAIAKAKRVEARHIGAKKPRGTMPGSRASGWKRRMDGTVVRRDNG